MIGQIYKHFKGGLYEIIAEGKDSETLEDVVVYKSLYDSPDFVMGTVWVRPRPNFFSKVSVDGKTLERFTLQK